MRNHLVLGLLLSPLCLQTMAFADGSVPSDSTPVELSAVGALSVGAGVLQTIATPIQFAGGLMDSQNPADVSGKAGRNLATGVSATGAGVVFLLEGTGKGLSELTVGTLEAGSAVVSVTTEIVRASIPTVTVTFNDKGRETRKSIPLVVRKQYVQMNEKLEDQPCL